MSTPQQVVCQNCHGIVRVPAGRLGHGPKCPRCHSALFDGQPVALGSGSFDRHLLKNDIPIVVDFWAPWCAPCRAMAPVFAAAAKEFEPQARFAKLNTDEAQDIAARHGIRSIPTLLVFKGGREIARLPGALDRGGLNRWLSAALAG